MGEQAKEQDLIPEELALKEISLPQIKLYLVVQIVFALFLAYYDVAFNICIIYFMTAFLTFIVFIKYKDSHKIISSFLHGVGVFHGVLGLIVFGWDFGAQNLIIWAIATNYLMLKTSSIIMFSTMISETLLYVVLFVNKEKFSGFGILPEFDFWLNLFVLGLVFVSSIRRVKALSKIYSDKISAALNENTVLERAAKFDFLTGLNNRREALARYKVMQENGVNSGVLVAIGDIDNFKNINDTFGHNLGDEIIKGVADVLSDSFREQRDIVARWGGEEFVLVLPTTNPDQTKVVLQKALYRINAIRTPSNQSIGMTFGIVECGYEWADLELEQIVKVADELLYEGKNSGKNKIESKKWS
jgi:signal transduction response regulator